MENSAFVLPLHSAILDQRRRCATLLLAVALISPPSLAQLPADVGGFPPAPSRPHVARNPSKSGDPVDAGAPVMVQLDQLENALKPSAEQRPAWDAYADTVLRLADEVARTRFAARAAPQPAQGSAAQQLDAVAAAERDRVAAVGEIVRAGKARMRH